jgi:hypothetical protein
MFRAVSPSIIRSFKTTYSIRYMSCRFWCLPASSRFLGRADHSSRGDLPSVVCPVCHREAPKGEAMTRNRVEHHKKRKENLLTDLFVYLFIMCCPQSSTLRHLNVQSFPACQQAGTRTCMTYLTLYVQS